MALPSKDAQNTRPHPHQHAHPRTRTQVNAEYAAELLEGPASNKKRKKQAGAAVAEGGNALGDSRFGAMFQDAAFSIDKESHVRLFAFINYELQCAR